jgi:hypothetical protein
MIGRLLDPKSFNSLEIFLAHKQVSLLIVFGGIKYILTIAIALVVYLGRWAFVILIIILKFIVDQHPFLLEPLA